MLQKKNKNLNERQYSPELFERFKNDKCFFFYLTFSKHNIHITVTNVKGNILMRDSSGTLGFLKSSRHSYLAFFEVGERIMWQFTQMNFPIFSKFIVLIKGTHRFKNSALFGLFSKYKPNSSRKVYIQDITSISHNGCRLIRKRRNRIKRSRFMHKYLNKFLL